MSAPGTSGTQPGFGLWTSTIMLKVVMALTGFGMALFVIGHMVGHLQMFLGRDAYNAYAEFLQHGLGKLIWVARLGLIGILLAHIATSVKLIQMNMAARPRDYARGLERRRSTAAGHYMRISGLTIGAFIAFHLAHFTFKQGLGLVPQSHAAAVDPMGRHDVYNFFVYSFQQPVLLVLYVGAIVALALHLSHAMSSMFKTLGIADGRFRAPLEKVGPAFAAVTLIGFLVPPLACAVGIIKPDYGQGDVVAHAEQPRQGDGESSTQAGSGGGAHAGH